MDFRFAEITVEFLSKVGIYFIGSGSHYLESLNFSFHPRGQQNNCVCLVLPPSLFDSPSLFKRGKGRTIHTRTTS